MALGRTRCTEIPAVKQKPLGYGRPLFGREQLLQICFNPVWIFRSRQAQPDCNPFHMGVDYDSRFFERVAEDDVGGFSSDSGQGHEFLHGGRNRPVETFGNRTAAGHDIFCLTFEKAGRTNQLFDLR